MATTKITANLIKDDAIGSAAIADDAITTAAIVDGAVTTAKTSGLTDDKTLREMQLEIADVKGTALNFGEGQADAYDSDTLATKTNATYDATNDYYHNPAETTLTPTSSDWTERGSGASYSSGVVNVTASGSVYSSSGLLTGDFTFEFKMSSTTSDWVVIGVFDTAEDPTSGSYQQAGMDAMTNSFYFSAGTPWIKKGSTSLDTSSWANTSDTFQIRRISDVISIYNLSTTTQIYAFSGTYSQDMRAAIGGGGSITASNIELTYGSGAANMTLVNNALTASSAPSTGFITVQAQPVDSITINTDLKAEISRDGGTTWTQVTLVAGATNSSFISYAGSVDISSQPSGTSMKYRVTTLNTKIIRVSGVVLRWS